MIFRDTLALIGCCAAAVCFTFGKPARANDVQSGQGTLSRTSESCVTSGAGTVSCERIGGHVRVDLNTRIVSAPAYGRPGASPVAVRIDEGDQPRRHLRLPAEQIGINPFGR
jgi:hypothetical protein